MSITKLNNYGANVHKIVCEQYVILAICVNILLDTLNVSLDTLYISLDTVNISLNTLYMANNVPSARLVTWRDSSDGLVNIQKLQKCPSRIFASYGSVTTENEHPEKQYRAWKRRQIAQQ